MENNEDKIKEIKIADRDIRLYLGQCIIDFQSSDELILSAGESFTEKMTYLAHMLNAVGIEVDKKYKSPKGVINFRSEVTETLDERTGRRQMKTFYKLGIIKHPDLFRFTDAEKALPFTEFQEEKPAKDKQKRLK